MWIEVVGFHGTKFIPKEKSSKETWWRGPQFAKQIVYDEHKELVCTGVCVMPLVIKIAKIVICRNTIMLQYIQYIPTLFPLIFLSTDLDKKSKGIKNHHE